MGHDCRRARPLHRLRGQRSRRPLYEAPAPSGEILRGIVTALGAIALIAGVLGLIADSAHALEILVVTTIALWGTATFWHVLSMGSDL